MYDNPDTTPRNWELALEARWAMRDQAEHRHWMWRGALLTLAVLAAVALALIVGTRDTTATNAVGLAYAGTPPPQAAEETQFVEALAEGSYLQAAGLSAAFVGSVTEPPLDDLTVAGIDRWVHANLPGGVVWLVTVNAAVDPYHTRGDLTYGVVGWPWSMKTWTTAVSHELDESLADTEIADPCESVSVPADARGWIYVPYLVDGRCVVWAG